MSHIHNGNKIRNLQLWKQFIFIIVLQPKNGCAEKMIPCFLPIARITNALCHSSLFNPYISFCFLVLLYHLLHIVIYTSYLPVELYGKRDDFNFPIVNFPFICSNIQVAPAHGVDISQLIRYSKACNSYHVYLDRELLLTRKPLKGSLWLCWSHHFESFMVTTMALLTVKEYLVHKLPRICSCVVITI
jgi:hypothetical protein